jgi:hypothetical protein
MAYKATPNMTKYSPFYLLQGREMPLPTSDDLKAKISKESPSHSQWLENLRNSLKSTYKIVKEANKKSHQHNKKLYDRKAKLRKIKTGALVYLYDPAIKPGLSKKFQKFWTGPYRAIAKLSELNCKIMDQENKTQVVHVNRLKANYSPQTWKPKVKQKSTRKPPKTPPRI